MPRTDIRLLIYWIILLVLIMAMTTFSQVWGQPGGMGGLMGGGGMGGPMDGGGGPGGGGPGGGPGPGGGRGQQTSPRFDMSKAITIIGQVESLGSYGTGSWRSLPGMLVQGLILKTSQGNFEVYLGPPLYVTKQKFFLQKGDTLKVKGLKVPLKDKPVLIAAEVKNNNQTLTLLDEQGFPLFNQKDVNGPEPERSIPRGRDPIQGGGGMMDNGSADRGMGPGGMGGGGMGKAR